MGSDFCLSVCLSVQKEIVENDVTLADEDSNSILTDDVKRAILGNVAIQVMPFGGQLCN